ncbi:MAG TPA: hypothetical protein PK876_09700 [Elusimicrobiota bacterium]|nr:hypothetical protein [Elusimicrobiota bacterium]
MEQRVRSFMTRFPIRKGWGIGFFVSLLILQSLWSGPMLSREEVKSQLRPSTRRVAAPAVEVALFKVSYDLAREADVSVTVLDLRRVPIHTFTLKRGQQGTQAGKNELILWNGRTLQDTEAPAGEYWASLSILYPDGQMETRRFRWVKN